MVIHTHHAFVPGLPEELSFPVYGFQDAAWGIFFLLLEEIPPVGVSLVPDTWLDFSVGLRNLSVAVLGIEIRVQRLGMER